MTNGDRIRTFSNEQLALTMMCPAEQALTTGDEECSKRYENFCHKGIKTPETNCEKCCYEWLNSEEVEVTQND